jgi:uncharacterized protein (TIGR00296 family)
MIEKNNFAYTDAEGIFLVQLARKTLTTFIESKKKIDAPKDAPAKLKEKSGVFVTLHVYSKGKKRMDLRGCIGRPYPEQSLLQATIDSAIDAGIHDSRFPLVKSSELDNIIFEITALTPPELIKATTPQGRLDAVEIGRDGLIIEMKHSASGGLFLPQVPIEWHWDVKTYLEELCGKARMAEDKWKKIDETNLYKFQGEIFSETKPKGEIVRKTLEECCD